MARSNVVSEETIFDLPIDEQKLIAKREGFANFDDWVKHNQKLLKVTNDFAQEADEAIAARQEGELPEGWTQETLDNWISKMSS